MINFTSIQGGDEYVKLLVQMGSLSRLFSQSDKPFIYYRFAENVFCKCFNALNLSRSDTAFDAKYSNLGVGLKTFASSGYSSLEKVAEFNTLSGEFCGLDDYDLAKKLTEFRNERISLAKRIYNINEAVYHIVARMDRKLVFFETDYDEIGLNLQNIKKTKSGIKFDDGVHEYSFNRSKSTLLRKFDIPLNAYTKNVEIIDDIYAVFANLQTLQFQNKPKIAGLDYVILPLYSVKNGVKVVYEKSGLNLWNAGGRKRDVSEMYIQIPISVREKYPNFFPSRDTRFHLKVPGGQILGAKICQDGAKALMSNPNKALSDWLLRKILKLNEGELATYDRMRILGFDSVIISRNGSDYEIDIMPLGSYERFC